MKKRRLFLNLSLLLSSVSLFSQGIELVTKIGSTPLKSLENIVVYSLPQTTLGINIIVSETQFVAGPFAAFANEYLGYQQVIPNDSKTFNIDSISIFTVYEPDSQQYYALKINKHFNVSNFLAFEKQGLITMPSVSEKTIKTADHNDNKGAIYKDLSTSKFYTEITDTFYKTILKDSVFVRIPILKTRVEAKTIREKAREAADLIMRIRQRRVDMLLSEEEAFPEERAFKLAITELQRIEIEYLTLFIGKSITKHLTSTFYFTPQKDEELKNLFWFSEQLGTSDTISANFSAISIQISKKGVTRQLANQFKSLSMLNNNLILYRMPDMATVKIFKNNSVLVSQTLPIYQFGVVVPAAVNW